MDHHQLVLQGLCLVITSCYSPLCEAWSMNQQQWLVLAIVSNLFTKLAAIHYSPLLTIDRRPINNWPWATTHHKVVNTAWCWYGGLFQESTWKHYITHYSRTLPKDCTIKWLTRAFLSLVSRGVITGSNQELVWDTVHDSRSYHCYPVCTIKTMEMITVFAQWLSLSIVTHHYSSLLPLVTHTLQHSHGQNNVIVLKTLYHGVISWRQ